MDSFAQTESSRCLHCKVPKCAEGCPVHYDIPLFLQCVKQGNYAQAIQIVGHLFGEVCGYICPRDKQCKGHCILGKCGQPVDVGAVERQVFSQYFPALSVTGDALCGRKIAVVGGGVSGITFAEQCYRQGAEVTLYEKNKLLHTLYSVPDFRLPREALDKIIAAVQNSNIKVVSEQVDSNKLQQLMQRNDAVYLATGVTVPNSMHIEGEQYATVADDFLRGNTFGKTIVVGGGNTAMDCARLNARKGGQTVVAYRRTRGDMPAFEQEIVCAEQDNVQFCYNLAPVSMQKHNGGLSVTFAKTVSEGRGHLTVTSEHTVMECDQLVVATGNRFDTAVFPAEKFVVVGQNNRVQGNLYAGGDATGKSLAVQAVVDGLTAARALIWEYKR